MKDNIVQQSYWNELWESNGKTKLYNTSDDSIKNYVFQRQHEFFYNYLDKYRGKKILEVGCGDSVWLPYFKSEYGFDIYGLDYSPQGCDRANHILQENDIEKSFAEFLEKQGIKTKIITNDIYAKEANELYPKIDSSPLMNIIKQRKQKVKNGVTFKETFKRKFHI